MTSSPEELLASFVAGSSMSKTPPDVVGVVKALLLDSLASAFAGRTAPDSSSVRQMSELVFGPGNSSIIGGGAASLAAATMVNSYSITARSFCDVHRSTLCHITPVVVPPVLALGQAHGVTGSDLLVGLAVGMETLLRVAKSFNYPNFRQRGWHSTGVAGPLASAMASARLLGLNSSEANNALGLAGTQSSGTFASLGTPAIKFHQSRAAVAGLVSAQLARTGFVASQTILSAEDGGLWATYTSGALPEVIEGRLGEAWHLDEIETRAWPAAAALQGVISVLIASNHDRASVSGIEVGLPSSGFEMHAGISWDSSFSAMLSARWVAAVTAVDGDFWLDQVSGSRLADRRVSELAEQVTVVEVPELEDGSCVMTLKFADGQQQKLVSGRAEKMVDRFAAAADKWSRSAQGQLAEADIETVVGMIADLENSDDVGGLFRIISP